MARGCSVEQAEGLPKREDHTESRSQRLRARETHRPNQLSPDVPSYKPASPNAPELLNSMNQTFFFFSLSLRRFEMDFCQLQQKRVLGNTVGDDIANYLAHSRLSTNVSSHALPWSKNVAQKERTVIVPTIQLCCENHMRWCHPSAWHSAWHSKRTH